MTAYFISYDLYKPGQNYDELHKAIKDYPKWAKVALSAYIVVTSGTASDVRDTLKAKIDSNDRLFVGKIGPDWASFNLTSELVEWLKNNL